jgi:glycosyltransferase involved in cell wall biosynthesis
MKNIYLLTNSLGGGGAERQAIALDGFIEIKKYFLLYDLVEYDDIEKSKIHHLGKKGDVTQFGIFAKIFSIFKVFFSLKKQVEKDSTIISFLEQANYINILSKLLFRHEAILNTQIVPSIENKRGIKRLNNLFIKILYPYADKICCNSELIKKDFVETHGLNPDKITVIYNSYDIPFVKNRANEALSEVEKKVFDSGTILLSAARLNINKGQWHMVRLFSELLKINSKVKLILLGQGELRDELFQLATDLKIKTYCKGITEGEPTADFDLYLWGFSNNPHKFMKNAEIFIFTSLLEGMPNSLNECLICGTPIISSDCISGPREILAPHSDLNKKINVPERTQSGILMPVFDGKMYDSSTPILPLEKLWVEEISALLDDKQRLDEYKKNAVKRGVEFDYLIKIEEWRKLILN